MPEDRPGRGLRPALLVLPAPFDGSALPDSDFPPRPAAGGEAGPALPTRQSLGFAAAPVPVDYAPPPQAPDFTVPSRAAGFVLSADTAPGASPAAEGQAAPASRTPASAGPAENPGYIWDLAATDVFPAAADPGPPTEAPGAVGEDGDPGAS